MMSFDDFMLIASGLGVVVSLAWMIWPRVRDHRAWKREFKSASEQLDRGIKENNDANFKAGLERFRVLMGLPPDEQDADGP